MEVVQNSQQVPVEWLTKAEAQQMMRAINERINGNILDMDLLRGKLHELNMLRLELVELQKETVQLRADLHELQVNVASRQRGLKEFLGD